jgi:hypothetical protein
VQTGALTTASGQALTQPQTATITVDELGNATGEANQGSFGVHLPKAPVKVGETWTQSTAIPGGASGGGSVSATYKFNGLKKVGKLSLADISFSLSSTGMVKGGTGHAYLLPSNCALSSMTMKMTVANPAGGGDLTTTVSMQTAK